MATNQTGNKPMSIGKRLWLARHATMAMTTEAIGGENATGAASTNAISINPGKWVTDGEGRLWLTQVLFTVKAAEKIIFLLQNNEDGKMVLTRGAGKKASVIENPRLVLYWLNVLNVILATELGRPEEQIAKFVIYRDNAYRVWQETSQDEVESVA